MSKIKSDVADFQDLERLIEPYKVDGRSTSISFLLWFLETVFRMDQVEAQDAVCDGTGDCGFDAIIADDLRQEIYVFQSKHREKLPATLGDVDLKTFMGALPQLASVDSVQALMASCSNKDLKTLLTEQDIANKVKAGYRLRPFFITNVAANEDARAYIKQLIIDGKALELWDLARLSPVLKQLQRDWFVPEEVRLSITPDAVFTVGGSKSNPMLVYAAVRANELVQLPGIDDSRIFAQNVRLGLGSTRVNNDIATSISNNVEHKDFLTFHNGLTFVAKSIRIRADKLILREFSVCNGCQSLLAFYNNRKMLTDELRVLVRVVRVGEDLSLPKTIAYRTNNQNSISLRDLSSNDITQVRLKSEFDRLFNNKVTYLIKTGEKAEGPSLANEASGRYILSLYLKEPWSAHQRYRIFGDLESRIFSYHISAAHIRLSQLLFELIPPRTTSITHKRLAKYGLTNYIILYCLGELIAMSESGKQILDDPLLALSTNESDNPNEDILRHSAGQLIDWLITELNYFVKEHGDDAYDYKREFKSQKAVLTLRDALMKAYEKDIYRDRVSRFELPIRRS